MTAEVDRLAQVEAERDHWKQVALRLDDENHRAQDEVSRCSAIALDNARARDAAQAELTRLRSGICQILAWPSVATGLVFSAVRSALSALVGKDP